jgi:hypothetical protein
MSWLGHMTQKWSLHVHVPRQLEQPIAQHYATKSMLLPKRATTQVAKVQ